VSTIIISVAGNSENIITVGLSYTGKSVGSRSEQDNNNGNAQKDGVELWVKTANDKGGIKIGSGLNETSYRVELMALSDNGTEESAVENYQQLVKNPNVTFLFGPIGSALSVAVAEKVTGPSNRLLIGVSVSSDVFAENNNAFSVIPRTSRLSLVALPFMRSNELVSVTYLIMDRVLGELACTGFDESAEENGVTKRDRVYVLQEGDTNYMTNWTASMEKIISLNNEALFVCGLNPQPAIEYMMPNFKKRDWTPKFMLALPYSAWVNFDPEMRNYVCGVKSISGLSTRRGEDGNNTAAFLESFGKFSNTPVTSHTWGAPAYVAGQMLERAINDSQSLDNDLVADAFRRQDMTTFLGRIRFDAQGQQLTEGVMGQYIYDVEETVGPLLSASRALVIPMPTWKERVFSDQFGDSSVEWVVLGIFIFAFGYSACLAIYVCIYRERLRFSSPAFLLGVDVGAILIYTSTLFATPNNSLTYACHLNDWLLFLGVNIMFGCLFAKSWKVFLINRNKRLKAVEVKDVELLPIVGVFVGICIILCVTFSATLQDSEITVVDEHRVSRNYYECNYSTLSTVIIAVQYVFVLVVMIIGSIITIQIRKVKILSEPKIFGFAIYNMTLFMSIAMLVRFTITQQNAVEERYIIHSICVILSAALSIFAMSILDYYVPKKHESSGNGSITDSNLDHVSKLTKISALQKQVTELKEKIKILEENCSVINTNSLPL